MLNLCAKNQNLRKTRDFLLPKLISGEVDVSKLDIKLSDSQLKFFNDYQSQQLPYKLDWPNRVCSIQELINQWAINDWFNAWSIAFTIGVFEDINGYRESQRLWSIDQQQFYSWDDVVKIESQYHSL